MIASAPIRLLPPAVADAIAAGEVVERPAAVVKELCENAIDAGARRIDVDIEAAGLVGITVGDDGAGIPADQLALAVARHATSKVAVVDDLAAVRSLGFRGEALASIAAVSDLRVVSRAGGADAAARIRVRGGEVLDTAAAARNHGTTVEVRDLFYNTPARLAFLRSGRGETAAAVRVVAELALCHPEIAFSCRSDDRLSLRTLGGDLDEALRAVFGADATELRMVAGDGEIRVTGRISEPRAHRGTRGHLVLVVNGRRVHNRSLVVAIEEAYAGLLPVSRHPFGVVEVSLDLAMVDVNVHPTKREVRFRDERAVFSAVQRACWESLEDSRLASPAWLPGLGSGARATNPSLELQDRGRPAPALDLRGRPEADAAASWLLPSSAATQTAASVDHRLADLAPLRPLAQAADGWLIAESPGGLVLVDPHAAHEKVIYAELLDQAEAAARSGRKPASQLLLIDAVVEVAAGAAERVIDRRPAITGLGFEIEAFGPGMLRCTAIPAAASTADPARLIVELVDTLAEEAEPGRRLHRLAALTACHAAIRLGDRLEPRGQARLLERLVVTPGGMTCPHGRPTLVVLDDRTLRQAFRRPVA